MIATRRRLARADEGFTLTELLLAITLMVIIMGALITSLMLALRTSVGLSSSAAVTGQDKYLIAQQIDSHIGMQDVSRSFTSDIENANDSSDVAVMGAASVFCVQPAGSSLGSDTVLASVVLRDGGTGAATDRVAYVYSVDSLQRFAQITRFDCTGAASANASFSVVTRGLSSSAPPSVSAQAPTASVPNWVYTLTLTTVSGRVYTIGATPAVVVSAAGGGGGAGTSPPPPFSSVKLKDIDIDGKIDQVLVSYESTVTLDSTCASGWALQGQVPSNGTQVTPAVVNSSAHTITIPITEGSGAADTATGSMTVKFTPAATCNLLGFSNIIPIDDAPPVLMNVASGPQPPATGVAGKMEIGDSVSLTFSEALDPTTIPQDVTVTEAAGPNGNDMLTIAGRSGTPSAGLNLTQAPVDMGTLSYLSGQKSISASYAGTVSLDSATAPTVITVTLPATITVGGVPTANTCTPGSLGDCSQLSAGLGTLVFDPATTLKSLVQTPDATSTAVSPVKKLGSNPVPGTNFRMF